MVDLECVDGHVALQEELHDVLVDVRDHRRVVVRVVPPPVLGTSVVVVQHPLQALQVLHEHLSLELCALRCGHILLELSLIIESLRLNRVP